MEVRRLNSALAGAAIAALLVACPVALAVDGQSTGGQAWTPEQAAPAHASYRPLVATWYGPGFFGRRTACGLTLTRRTVGVAHRRLPCGTRVALRFHGRSLVAPVIDRGPFTRGVQLDLTSAAARRLGLTATARVRAAALTRSQTGP